MKRKSHFTNFRKLLVVFIALASTVLATTTASAWGPERTTYTNEKPADYATFNSITNNAAVGDERNFVRIREAGTSNHYVDELEVVPGKEYEVYIYFHNDAASDTNDSGYGVATNTRVASAYPTVVNTGERGMVSGFVTWSYVTPSAPKDAKTGKIWDEAYVTTKTNGTVLRYKTGTATIHNGGAANGTVLSTDLFTEGGTLIGYNKLAGTIPGCAEYSGYITYTLVAENPGADFSKQVSVDGENWHDSVTVTPGDFVTYKVMFKNTGNTNFTNAIFTDNHDGDLLLRANSTIVYDYDHVDGHSIENIIDTSGYNVETVYAGELVQVIYQMQVKDDNSVCGRTLNNTMFVKYNSNEQKSGTAEVKVSCSSENTPEDCSANPNLPGCSGGSGETCATNPNLPGCERIPDTGPAEIVMAVIVVLGIGAGGFYLWRTRRTLKAVEDAVSGPASLGTTGNDKKPKPPTEKN